MIAGRPVGLQSTKGNRMLDRRGFVGAALGAMAAIPFVGGLFRKTDGAVEWLDVTIDGEFAGRCRNAKINIHPKCKGSRRGVMHFGQVTTLHLSADTELYEAVYEIFRKNEHRLNPRIIEIETEDFVLWRCVPLRIDSRDANPLVFRCYDDPGRHVGESVGVYKAAPGKQLQTKMKTHAVEYV